MTLKKRVEVFDELLGEGPEAVKGAVVVYNARFFLRRGDEVTQDAEIIARAREHLRTRIIDGKELIDHVTERGKRRTIAGVMRAKGYREVLVSPPMDTLGEPTLKRGKPFSRPRDLAALWTVCNQLSIQSGTF